jgi:hypothetical protein
MLIHDEYLAKSQKTTYKEKRKKTRRGIFDHIQKVIELFLILENELKGGLLVYYNIFS